MKPEVHQELTRIAIQEFQDQLPTEILEYRDQIIKGTIIEDNVYTFPPTRLWNWHFYRQKNSNNSIPERVKLYMRPTSEVIFGKRIKTMIKLAKNNPKRYEYLGRIIHHIQDMSTPSHVVPIYHAKKPTDYFESFMVYAIKNFEFDSKISTIMTDPNIDLEAIYDNAAKEMLAFLKDNTVNATVNGEDKTELKLNIFWQNKEEEEDIKHTGFGTYGILHGYFDKPREKKFSTDGNEYFIEYREFQHLSDKVCEKAIINTFRALICACQPKYFN